MQSYVNIMSRSVVCSVVLATCLQVYAASISSVDPKKSIAPVTVIPSYAAVKTPSITSVTPVSCLKPTDKILLTGSNFASSSGRRVALTGNGVHVDLALDIWKDTLIYVYAPNDSQLIPGLKYSLVIETSTHTPLSNLYGGVQVCAASSAPSATVNFNPPTPALAKPGTATDTPNQSDAMTETGLAYAPPNYTPPPVSTGSLSNRMMPPPPTINPAAQQQEDGQIEPGEIVVVSVDMQAAENLRQIVGNMGLRVIRRTRLDNLGLVLTVLRVPKEMKVNDALLALRQQLPDIWMDSNARYRLQGESSDAARYHYGEKLVQWRGKVGCGRNARIGIVDSAIDMHHPALQGQRIQQKSFLPAGIDAAPAEHGTAIAALLVGKRTQQKFTGLIPEAQLVAANVFRQRDADNIDTTAELIVRALDWLVGEHVTVINLSLGGDRNLLLEAAVTRALQSNIAIVAAAGNSGPQAAPAYPAAHEGVIAVTALDANMEIYAKANHGDYITIAAPGVDIWAAVPGGDGRYFSGTSYAVPFVTAYVALQTKYDQAKLLQRLQQQARDLGSKGRDAIYGWGLLQAQQVCTPTKPASKK